MTSFRCHETMVIAEVESKEIVFWGVLNEKTEIKSPQCVPSGKHPRDMFGLTPHPATGGVVYIGKHWFMFYHWMNYYMPNRVCEEITYLPHPSTRCMVEIWE